MWLIFVESLIRQNLDLLFYHYSYYYSSDYAESVAKTWIVAADNKTISLYWWWSGKFHLRQSQVMRNSWVYYSHNLTDLVSVYG